MINRAIEKINAEMQEDSNNRFVEVIGHYIIDRCTDEVTAEKVMAEDKTLEGAISAVAEVARKDIKNNVAVLGPKKVFDEVDDYFGLSLNEDVRMSAMASVAGHQTASKPPQPQGVSISLDDFL